MQNKLPQGWVECQLGEVFNIERGGSPRPIKEYLTTSTDGINWIKIGDTKNTSKYIYETKEKIKPEGLKYSRFVDIGDFLLTNSMSFGKPYIMKTTGCIHDGWVVFRNTYKIVNEEFLYYILSSKKIYAEFSRVATGSTVKNLNIDRIKGISILIPPLNEQRRIVEKIESEFAKIDEGLEHLENAKEQIKQYRQSVLKSAFEGKLYKTSNWKETTLNDCTSKLGDGLHGTPKYSDDGDFYFINGNNLNDGVIEIKKDTKKVNFEEYQKYKKELNNNTVLVSINGTIGNTAFYNNEKVILGKSACYFNLINNVDKYFIRYLLKTNYFLNYANKNATGSTIKNVSLKVMREFSFKLPLMLEEQKEIVKEIEKRFAVAKEVEKVVEENIEKAKQLKQSILKKAFEGRLVPQDPTDEPASILLEKIKQERSK